MLLANLICLYLLSVSVAVVYCSVLIKTFNGSGYTKATLLLCFAICFYILGYAMELHSVDTANILFWNRIEYIGIPYVSGLWLTTALLYTGCLGRRKLILLPAIFGIPIVSQILRYTNDYHHLYFASQKFVQRFGMTLFVKQPGPWMVVQMVHSSLMIFASMVVLIYYSYIRGGKQLGKLLLLIAASLFAVAGFILPKYNPLRIPLDYMALSLPITCVLMILAVLRYDLLETKSIARSKAFDAGSDAILLMNRRNMVMDYNGSAKRLFEQLHVHLDYRDISHPLKKFPDFLQALINSESSIISLPVKEDLRYFEITTQNIDKNNALRGWIKTIRDITEIHELNQELKRQATTDDLSVLTNRRAFINTGREWVERSEQGGEVLHLVMIDLDHFKVVNDLYGHPTGDYVIREFAKLLKNHFDTNSLVARLGGEEFAVLQAGLGDGDMMLLLSSFLKATQLQTYSHLGNRFHVTVSIGMTKKQPGQALESMMGKADRALYQSKDRGRNCFTVL